MCSQEGLGRPPPEEQRPANLWGRLGGRGDVEGATESYREARTKARLERHVERIRARTIIFFAVRVKAWKAWP